MATFVHIPRTGGLALTDALRGSGVLTPGHMVRLSEVDGDVITIVRDPVARFISAHDHQCPDFPIEELAHDPSLGGWFLAPMVRWLDSDRPLLWVGRTETLDVDFIELCDLLGLRGRALPRWCNASRSRSTLTPDAMAAVRSWYAEDLALLERIA